MAEVLRFGFDLPGDIAMKQVNVGLVGFGTVGTGVARILIEQRELLEERTGVRLNLKRIVDVDMTRDRGLALPPGVLTDRLDDLLGDPEITCGVELVGGIGVAREIILKMIDAGKPVVTANKALLAQFGPEILKRASDRGVSVSFEASVCGGIPIILAIRDGMVANRLESIVGIVNGTSNFILTSMKKRGVSYAQAVAEAQRLGYAEADPTLDVEGIDASHKLAILASLGFGADFDLKEIAVEGITHIDVRDIQYAGALGYEVKLLAIARRSDDGLELRVHPAMIPTDHPLAWVDGPMNAVLVVGNNVGPLLFHGQGAGMMPTASAVVSDIVDVAVGKSKITFENFRFLPGKTRRATIRPMESHRGRYYLRFTALDQPGVLASIAGSLGRHGISILSVVQKESRGGSAVPIVMMADEADEANVRKAVLEIDRLECVHDRTVWIRVER
jgi:homoserine dehydrogenase